MEITPVGFVEYKKDMGECPACEGTGKVKVYTTHYVVSTSGHVGGAEEIEELVPCVGCSGMGRVYQTIRKDILDLGLIRGVFPIGD